MYRLRALGVKSTYYRRVSTVYGLGKPKVPIIVPLLCIRRGPRDYPGNKPSFRNTASTAFSNVIAALDLVA